MTETVNFLSAATSLRLQRPFHMLIDGALVEAASGRSIDSVNPADGTVLASAPAGDEIDIGRAVDAARAAFEARSWSGLTPGTREQLMWRLSDLLASHSQEFAELETLDNGKPITMSRALDVPASVAMLRYWAGWCTKINGSAPLADLPADLLAVSMREPVGVAALITPWNFPLANAVAKLAPALAAGCTTILKPAEQTSLTALRLGELLLEAGIPDGVVNIVSGQGQSAGASLAHHNGVDKISFTGSTSVGKQLISAARGNLKRLTLELGGKSPTIIFADADLARAIPATANGIFRNAGQMCAAGSRLYVHSSCYDQVLDGLIAHGKAHRLGPGIDPSTTMGPLISASQRDRVMDHVSSARHERANIVCGGSTFGDRGYFVEPTIIADIGGDSRVAREEIFGPVLVVTRLEDMDSVHTLANDTVYGLSANIWTRDVAAAHKLARRVRAGTVTINTGMVTGPNLPFGGFKQSGWGREGGADGLAAFTEIKTVVTAM